MFIAKELRTLYKTANTSQYENYGLSFPQISQFLICIKIRQEEVRVGSGVNIGYVSHTQMAWNVVNEADKSFWSSVYI